MPNQSSEGVPPQGKVVIEIDVRHLGALLDPGAAYRLRNAILEALDPQLGKTTDGSPVFQVVAASGQQPKVIVLDEKGCLVVRQNQPIPAHLRQFLRDVVN